MRRFVCCVLCSVWVSDVLYTCFHKAMAWIVAIVDYTHVQEIKGGLHLKPPKFEHIFVAVITPPPLSSVQILLIPACCLLCVL